MPNIEDGFKRAAYSIVGGFLISAYLNNQAKINPIYENIAVAVTILSIFGVIEIIENSTYWGIGYTLGYLIGIALVSRLMSPWEKDLLSLMLVVAIIQKVARKLRKYKI